MSNSESVVDAAEVNTTEAVSDSEKVDVFSDSAEDAEEIAPEATGEDFWKAFEDEEAESLTTVWVCDVSFSVRIKELPEIFLPALQRVRSWIDCLLLFRRLI